MHRSTLKRMICPKCFSPLDVVDVYRENRDSLRYAVIGCGCGLYPVIDRILLYRRGGYRKGEIDAFLLNQPGKAIFQVLNRELFDRACQMKRFSTWRRIAWRVRCVHWEEVISRYMGGVNQPLFDLIEDWGDRDWENYLKYQPSAPTYLILLHLFHHLSLPRNPNSYVLDLCSGLGHFSSLLANFFPESRIVCVDLSFLNLYINSKYMTPGTGADFILLYANDPLPFYDDVFSLCLHVDSFHYIRDKETLSGEMMRVLQKDGMLLLAHLHNVLRNHVSPGWPLDPSAYRELFSRKEIRVYDEEALFRSLTRGEDLDFGKDVPVRDINRIKESMMVIGSGDLLKPGRWSRARPISPGCVLSLNPLFRFEKDGELFYLRRSFPSRTYRREYNILIEYLPEKTTIRVGEWDRLVSTSSSNGTVKAIRACMNRGILVSSPKPYFRSSWPSLHIPPVELFRDMGSRKGGTLG